MKELKNPKWELAISREARRVTGKIPGVDVSDSEATPDDILGLEAAWNATVGALEAVGVIDDVEIVGAGEALGVICVVIDFDMVRDGGVAGVVGNGIAGGMGALEEMCARRRRA
ncbi:uncharacterized protein KY384_004665 [Bacidia gigantensis]|uniref:uncharacterized protein n=1 Tax=Bacidia gigantensis TaxID=2732470 RepID=UPI001D050751|nr:uncharacterized protein KY384_004665 [Bacidia gigantensis]KAG8530627.1 hypothetical protein KY384_004665 [Bacidia gigantensis]